MISLYWEIGKSIVGRQETAGWGDEIVDRLSYDLMKEFPALTGFSRRNLYRMRTFYLTYQHKSEFVAQIPWGRNLILIKKLKDPAEREWYAQNAGKWLVAGGAGASNRTPTLCPPSRSEEVAQLR